MDPGDRTDTHVVGQRRVGTRLFILGWSTRVKNSSGKEEGETLNRETECPRTRPKEIDSTSSKNKSVAIEKHSILMERGAGGRKAGHLAA